MQVPQHKRCLPKLLHRMTLKYNTLLLQKLILLEEQKIDCRPIRNYDLQCEAIQMLVGFFKTKHQNVLLKAFTNIREYTYCSQDKGCQLNQKPHGTTRRTYLNTTFTASQCSPIKEIFCHTIKSKRSEKDSSLTAKSQLNRTSTNLQQLLNRVKLTNSKKEEIHSFRKSQENNSQNELRQNFSQYVRNAWKTPKTAQQQQRYHTNPSNCDPKEVNYYDYYKSQVMSTRNSRRQFIMDKFNQIQNKIEQLSGKKEPKKPQLSKQILNEINNIKQRLKLQL